MRRFLAVSILTISCLVLWGQVGEKSIEGTVSFVTLQNVYVKFESTEGISTGDTLSFLLDNVFTPGLLVKDLSSISCVCTPLISRKFGTGDKVSIRKVLKIEKSQEEKLPDAPAKTVVGSSVVTPTDSLPAGRSQDINGRLSLSSYSNFSNVSAYSQRMRYNFSMNALNIGGSGFSAETYISFVHSLNEWSEIKKDVFNGLKIYNLALNYSINKNNNVWIGRKINPRLSSVGAIDGIQFESKFKAVTMGVIGGSRPDYMNYSINPELMQFGGYFSHDYATSRGTMQTVVAIVEQKNKGITDRRFAYLQYTNSLVKNLYLFGSVEADLYNKVWSAGDSMLARDRSPKLSNLYFSVRYRLMKNLSMSVSYNSRQNIIYYESYKDIIGRLLEENTLKGYTFQVSYRPVNNLAIGINAGYRSGSQDARPTRNLYSYMTYSNLPVVKGSVTLSATLVETSYLSSNIYSLGFSRDLLKGKVFSGANYRFVKYKFLSAETPLVQHMAEVNLGWRILKKLSCSLNFEGTFEPGRNYERIYLNLSRRF